MRPRGRDSLVVAVLLCLAGAGLLLVACSRTWVSVEVPALPPLPGRTISAKGSALAPGVRALALVGLAGVAALPATRSWGRLAVGGVVALAGAAAGVLLVRAMADPSGATSAMDTGPLSLGFAGGLSGLGGWPYVGLVGALLLVAAGGLTLVRGRTWSALGSSYDAPTAPKPTSAWDALDAGVDPTA